MNAKVYILWIYETDGYDDWGDQFFVFSSESKAKGTAEELVKGKKRDDVNSYDSFLCYEIFKRDLQD